jgi:Plavaka transposase
MEVLAALYSERAPSIGNHTDLYRLTDNIPQGDIAWNSFSVQYNHDLLIIKAPRLPWMDQTYEVWFRNPLDVLENQIRNPDFKHERDCSPKRIFYKGKRWYENSMSGNWAWEQAV